MALTLAKTESGTVEGMPAGNQRISVFRGIPYAAPPVGNLRWREPQKAEKWDGVRKCYKFANIPSQPRSAKGSFYQIESDTYEWPMSEDCLYLNVWTPAEAPDEKLPVTIYIFGGGMRQGYGHKPTYDGEAFARRGMVYVNFNYRVNFFGYFAHPELTRESPIHTSGSYGTLDQIAAIQWVYRNIAAFGGDPDHISIFGQSAGADCTRHMILTPHVNGIIKNAVIQSGGGLGYLHGGMTATLDDGEKNGTEILKLGGVKTIDEARNLTEGQILDMFETFKKQFRGLTTFYPLIDGYITDDCPANMIRNGKHADIPYIIGSCEDEDFGYDRYPPKDPEDVIEGLKKVYGKRTQEYVQAAKLYDKDAVSRHDRYLIGSYMMAGAKAFCENQLTLGRTPAYHYIFTHCPPNREGGRDGAYHSAEHPYINETLFRMDRPYEAYDFTLSQKMCTFWANFMKTGNPNDQRFGGWTPYTKSSPLTMEFGGNDAMFDFKLPPIAKFFEKCGEEGLE